MTKSERIYFGLGGVCTALFVITCGSTIPLINRVGALEDEVNREPVVIDANRKEVGRVDSIYHYMATVLMDVQGFPLFTMGIIRQNILQNGISAVLYSSDDCTGNAYVEYEPFRIISELYADDRQGHFSFVADVHSTPQEVLVNSHWIPVGESTAGEALPVECFPLASAPGISLNLVPALPVFVWREQFTPPFTVVTRGELGAD